MAAVLAKQLRPHLPEGSTIDVLPYSGGIGNIKLIEAGKADLGADASCSDSWAAAGKVIFKKKFVNLRHLITLEPFYFIVYATKKSGITSLEQAFKAKKPIDWVALPPGATGEVTTRLMLEDYGLSYDTLKKWGGSITNTGWTNVVTVLKDGRADIVTHCVGVGHPSVTEINLTVPGRFLKISESAQNALFKDYGYAKVVMPAKTYKNQPESIATVAYYATVSCSAKLPEEVAYLVAKIFAEEKEDLVKGHKTFGVLAPQESCEPGKYGAPIHPGAARYYRERGWMK
jgi:TRAP transporter TAXI family solute receptor